MDAIYAKLSRYTDVSQAEAEQFLRVPHRVVDVDADAELVALGAPARHVFIVEEGWAIRFRLLEDGRRQIVNFMLPGDCFDLQALIHAQADHAVTAVTDMRVRKTSSSRFLQVMRSNSRIATAFWWAAVQEEAILREQIVRIGRRNALERVAHLLLELHRRLTLAGVEETASFALPLSRAMIGDALGLSPIHVSRTLSRLRNDGLITTSPQRVTLRDRDQMVALTGFDPASMHLDSRRRISLRSGKNGS